MTARVFSIILLPHNCRSLEKVNHSKLYTHFFFWNDFIKFPKKEISSIAVKSVISEIEGRFMK